MKLTEEQVAVVSATDARFTVRAGAGSGKTRVLVDRYVRHVAELGHEPDSIVAVTFTRKAAAEMKKRIVARLRDLGLSEQAQSAETGPIQTLHAFCERVLRENCVEALVSPDFEVLETADVRLRTESAVRAALLQVLDEDSEPASLVRLLSGQSGGQGPGWTHSQLRSMVEAAMTQFRGAGIERSRLANDYATAESTRSLWNAALISALGLEGALPSAEDGSVAQWIEHLKASGAKPPPWLKSQPEESEQASATDTSALVQLAARAWELLEDDMELDQAFDFAVLERKAVELVERSPVTRERLKSSIKALLVDEAQDLNPVQYRLIDRLGAPSEMLVLSLIHI